MAEAYDAHLQKLLKAHTVKLGKQGEFRFVDTFFGFLRRHTEVLNSIENIEKLQEIAQKHCGDALDEYYVSDEDDDVDGEIDTSVLVRDTAKTIEPEVKVPKTTPSKVEVPVSSTTASNNTSNSENNEQEDKFWKPYRTNGGFSKNHGHSFYWSQTLRELTLSFPLKEAFQTCEIDCTLESGSIIINGETYLQGTFARYIRADECTWTIDRFPSVSIVIVHLEKQQTEWWSSILVDVDEIDTNALPPITNMDELDDSSKNMIKESLFKPQEVDSTRQSQLAKLQEAHPDLDFSKAKIQ